MDKLRSIAFEPVQHGESTLTRRDLRMVPSVYVDGFKSVGPETNMKKAWSLIRGIIAMDEAPPLGQYLGCGHENIVSVPPVVIRTSPGHAPLLSSQHRATHTHVRGATPALMATCRTRLQWLQSLARRENDGQA